MPPNLHLYLAAAMHPEVEPLHPFLVVLVAQLSSCDEQRGSHCGLVFWAAKAGWPAHSARITPRTSVVAMLHMIIAFPCAGCQAIPWCNYFWCGARQSSANDWQVVGVCPAGYVVELNTYPCGGSPLCNPDPSYSHNGP